MALNLLKCLIFVNLFQVSSTSWKRNDHLGLISGQTCTFGWMGMFLLQSGRLSILSGLQIKSLYQVFYQVFVSSHCIKSSYQVFLSSLLVRSLSLCMNSLLCMSKSLYQVLVSTLCIKSQCQVFMSSLHFKSPYQVFLSSLFIKSL